MRIQFGRYYERPLVRLKVSPDSIFVSKRKEKKKLSEKMCSRCSLIANRPAQEA